MKVLYIAYSCSESYGSEDKIGWNIPLESAKYNEVLVITKEEHRAEIERYTQKNALLDMQFLFVDIPKIYKCVFKGSLYPARLIFWQSRALKLARRICRREKIDVIHQITPVEFRSIGNYGSIDGTKFVCGPIAGGQSIPKELRYYAKGHLISESARELANKFCRFKLRINGALKRCDHIIFANGETKDYLQRAMSEKTSSEMLTDVMVKSSDLLKEKVHAQNPQRKTVFLVAARLVYLKGHALLFEALEQLKDRDDIICRVVGEGPLSESLKKLCAEKGLESLVEFSGNIPYSRMAEIYDIADVLVLPSLREATGSVIIEGMARGLPVITVSGFGGAQIVSEDTGWLYSGNTKEEYIKALKDAIVECLESPDEVKRKGENALKAAGNYTFEKRARYYQNIYES